MAAGADIELPPDGFVLGELLAGVDDFAIELTQFVPTGKQLIQYFWVRSAERERIEALLEADDRTAAVAVHDVRAGQALVEVTWATPVEGLLAILLDLDILIREGHGTQDGWEFEFFVNDTAVLTEFQERCQAAGLPIDVRAVYDSGPSASNRVAFTDRQREVLTMAVERGYFSIPRDVTISDISDELGITPQATSKLLRRGLETAVEYALDGSR